MDKINDFQHIKGDIWIHQCCPLHFTLIVSVVYFLSSRHAAHAQTVLLKSREQRERIWMCEDEDGDAADWIERAQQKHGARRAEAKDRPVFGHHHKRLWT